MKKILIFVFVFALAMLAACGGNGAPAGGGAAAPAPAPAAGGATEAADTTGGNEQFVIGVTYADLVNPVWAEIATSIETRAAEHNARVILVDAGNDASTQVNQIEAFVAQGVDGIIIGATDIGTIDVAARAAMDAGIVVLAYGTEMQSYTVTLLADNVNAGRMLAEAAASFIDEVHGGSAVVGLINYYGSPDTLQRAETMREVLGQLSPGSTIAMEGSAVTADTGLMLAENFIAAHPDMRVIMCIGDGPGVGAVRAVIAAGLADDDFGVFSIDGTIEALQMMANGEPMIANVSFGAGWQLGLEQLELMMRVLSGEDVPPVNRLPNTLATRDNLRELVSVWGFEDEIDLSRLP